MLRAVRVYLAPSVESGGKERFFKRDGARYRSSIDRAVCQWMCGGSRTIEQPGL